MGRRDPDPRPPIELIGADPPAVRSPHRVTIASRRPRRRLGRALAVAGGVAALFVAGLTLGADGEGPPAVRMERDNRARVALKKGRATTTTDGEQQFAASSTTIPPGPVLGQPVGASLLLAGRGARWTLIDLDTGARDLVLVPADDLYSVVPVRNGVVALGNGRARRHPLPNGAPVDLGPAEQVLSSGRPDRVWLIDKARGFDGQPAGAGARLVDLDGGVLERFEIPVPYPAAATADGLLYIHDDQTRIARASGVSLVAPGPLLAAAGDLVVFLACDAAAACRPEAVDLSTGGSVTYETTPDAARYAVQVVLAPDGRLAIASSASADGPGVLTVFSADGRAVFEIHEWSLLQPPVWLPLDRGLLTPAGAGRQRLSAGADGMPQLDPVPALDALPGVPYVIPR